MEGEIWDYLDVLVGAITLIELVIILSLQRQCARLNAENELGAKLADLQTKILESATKIIINNGSFIRDCQDLCKAAERFQDAVNELWKAQNPEELLEGDTFMSEDEALENHAECWDYLKLSIHNMQKRVAGEPK